MSNYFIRWSLIDFMGETHPRSVEFSKLSRSSDVAGESSEAFRKEGSCKVALEGVGGY